MTLGTHLVAEHNSLANSFLDGNKKAGAFDYVPRICLEVFKLLFKRGLGNNYLSSYFNMIGKPTQTTDL